MGRRGAPEDREVIKLIIIIVMMVLIVFLMSGCSTVQRIVDFGADANDEAVTSARFVLCDAASVGSIKRSFSTPEEAEIWLELCSDNTAFKPVDNND